MVKLAKKADLNQCTYWRGLTLLNTINKILYTIVYGQILNVLNIGLRKERRNLADPVIRTVKLQALLYMMFIDFKLDFDSVQFIDVNNINKLWSGQ